MLNRLGGSADYYVGALLRMTWLQGSLALFVSLLVFWSTSGSSMSALLLAFMSSLPMTGLGDDTGFGPLACTSPRVLGQLLSLPLLALLIRTADQLNQHLALAVSLFTSVLVFLHPPTGAFFVLFVPLWYLITGHERREKFRMAFFGGAAGLVAALVYMAIARGVQQHSAPPGTPLYEIFQIRFGRFIFPVPLKSMWQPFEAAFYPLGALFILPAFLSFPWNQRPQRGSSIVIWILAAVLLAVFLPITRLSYWLDFGSRWAATAHAIGESAAFVHHKTHIPALLFVVVEGLVAVYGGWIYWANVRRRFKDTREAEKHLRYVQMIFLLLFFSLTFSALGCAYAKFKNTVPIVEFTRSSRLWFLVLLLWFAFWRERMPFWRWSVPVLACLVVMAAPRYESLFNFVRTLNRGVVSMPSSLQDVHELSLWAKNRTEKDATFLFLNENPEHDENVRSFWLLAHRSVAFCSKAGGALLINDWTRLAVWNERRLRLLEATPSSWRRVIADCQPPLYLVSGNDAGESFGRDETGGHLVLAQGAFKVWKQ